MDDLGIRPLNARSLVLSVLLGLPTPRLAAASTGRLAELFGIAPGTMRTAISRMLAAGELATVDGGYELRGPLVERKAAQDVGRRPAGDAWDGTWWIVTVTSPSRDLAARREFRTAMANARMGELRPDTWLRPANLAGPRAAPGRSSCAAPSIGEDAAALAAPAVGPRRRSPRGAPSCSTPSTRASTRSEARRRCAGGIMLAAAVVRFLRAEPLLPRSP